MEDLARDSLGTCLDVASIAPKLCRAVYLSPPKKKKDAIGNPGIQTTEQVD